MKKFLIVAIVIVIIVVTITICLKSCVNTQDNGLLDLLPKNLLPESTTVITPDPIVIVEQIQQLARLETVSITMQHVLTAEKDQDWFWGACGEKLVFLAYGQVIAGIDFEKIQEQDIQIVDPKTIKVHLPQAEIFNVVLDNEKSSVVDRDSGIFATVDPQLETRVRKKADEVLLQNAKDLGIIDIANKNAEIVVGELLRKFGFESVEFVDSADIEDQSDTKEPVKEINIELN